MDDTLCMETMKLHWDNQTHEVLDPHIGTCLLEARIKRLEGKHFWLEKNIPQSLLACMMAQ